MELEVCSKFKCDFGCDIDDTPHCYGHNICLSKNEDGRVFYYRDDVLIFSAGPRELHTLVSCLLQLREQEVNK